MFFGEQLFLSELDVNRPTADLFDGLSTQEVMSSCDAEERISEWLENLGITPESPSMKRHKYFEQNRNKALHKMSGYPEDFDNDEAKPLGNKTISQSTMGEDVLPRSNKSERELFSCQGSSLLSRRGFKANNLRLDSDWSPISVSCRLENTGAERQNTDSKLTKSSFLTRRKLLDIEPLNLPSTGKTRSGESCAFTTICKEDLVLDDFQMFNSAKELKQPKSMNEDTLEPRGRLATTGSIEYMLEYVGTRQGHSSLQHVEIPKHKMSAL